MRAEAKITSKGQITLPKRLREEMGVGSGDKIIFWRDEQGLRVSALTSTLADLKGIVKSGSGPFNDEQVVRWIDEGRSARWRQFRDDR